jgi:hypothetical protein
MASLRHPNVVDFFGICVAPPCAVTEFCARGSLYDLLQEARSSPALQAELTWARRLRMVRQPVKDFSLEFASAR